MGDAAAGFVRLSIDRGQLNGDPAAPVTAIYPDAVDLAVKETGLAAETFPMGCPYQPGDILADDYYPYPGRG